MASSRVAFGGGSVWSQDKLGSSSKSSANELLRMELRRRKREEEIDVGLTPQWLSDAAVYFVRTASTQSLVFFLNKVRKKLQRKENA